MIEETRTNSLLARKTETIGKRSHWTRNSVEEVLQISRSFVSHQNRVFIVNAQTIFELLRHGPTHRFLRIRNVAITAKSIGYFRLSRTVKITKHWLRNPFTSVFLYGDGEYLFKEQCPLVGMSLSSFSHPWHTTTCVRIQSKSDSASYSPFVVPDSVCQYIASKSCCCPEAPH